MTPWEFSAAIDGATERRYYEHEAIALLSSNLARAWGAKVSPETYFIRPGGTEEFHSDQELTQAMEEAERKAEEGGA